MTEFVRADDFVECSIFPLNFDSLNVDTFDELYNNILKFINELTADYIWHKDCLKFHKRFHHNNVSLNEEESNLPSHIQGLCHFGDNLEDEWFIVYLMKELTKQFHDLAVKIEDSDGEFLLIEAANSLPSWLNPNNSSNRVFFYKGSLIILKHDNLEEDEDDLCIKDALNIIQNGDKLKYLASKEIMEDIQQRIGDYPAKIQESLHKTTVYTPVGVAALLNEDPSLISDAVHAFCNRDPIDLKVCRAMRYFPPENRVNTSVTFTKCLYAMLIQNSFTADRRTGWNLPLLNSTQYKAHNLGMKLACGFEILVSQAKPSESFECNKSWEVYLDSLKKRNYFQNLIEHSQQYNLLLENAKDYYKNNLQTLKLAPIIGTKILSLLNTLCLDEKVFRDKEAFLPEDDDDKWLLVDPKDLENLLEKRYGTKQLFNINGNGDNSEVAGKLNDFLEQMSGIEGVEFPEESARNGVKNLNLLDPPVRPKRGIKTKKNSKEGCSKLTSDSRSPSLTRKCNIDFDPDQFTSQLKNILDFVIPDDKWNSESESDLSDYGSDDDMLTNIIDLKSKKSKKGNDKSIKDYMKAMDIELSSTSIGKSFETCVDSEGNVIVDIDKTTTKNITQSYMAEAGGAGPAGNLLGPLGFTKFDPNNSIDDEID